MTTLTNGRLEGRPSTCQDHIEEPVTGTDGHEPGPMQATHGITAVHAGRSVAFPPGGPVQQAVVAQVTALVGPDPGHQAEAPVSPAAPVQGQSKLETVQAMGITKA